MDLNSWHLGHLIGLVVLGSPGRTRTYIGIIWNIILVTLVKSGCITSIGLLLVTCLSVTYYYTVKQLIRAFFSPDIFLLYLSSIQDQCMSTCLDGAGGDGELIVPRLLSLDGLKTRNNQTETNIQVIWLNQKHIWWDPAGGRYWWCWLEYLISRLSGPKVWLYPAVILQASAIEDQICNFLKSRYQSIEMFIVYYVML